MIQFMFYYVNTAEQMFLDVYLETHPQLTLIGNVDNEKGYLIKGLSNDVCNLCLVYGCVLTNRKINPKS